MTIRRGAFAIAIFSASVAAVGGCFSLKADDDLPLLEAGSIDASSKDAARNSARDATTRTDHDALFEASGGDATVGDDVADGADIEDVAEASDSADGADALGDGADDGSSDAGNASDFYVNLTPPDGGPTYPTIHAALDAANASSAPTRTIHVGPGTYSTAESFPIVLRDGVSLVGSGLSTVLSGAGPAAISPPVASQSIASANVTATIVVGDSAKATTIASLLIQGPAKPSPGSEGIACDRGVTTAPGHTAPNTFIDDVTIDGLEIGLNVTTAVPPSSRSGCAGRITRSTLKNGSYGVVVGGLLSGYDGSLLQLVSVEVGDGTPDSGNGFNNFHDNPGMIGSGAGILSLDAVTGVSVIGNSISNVDHGIWMNAFVPSDPASGMDIEQNDLGPTDNTGILLTGPAIVARMVGNTIHNVTTWNFNEQFVGNGLVLDDNGTLAMPTVLFARDNTFFGNDVGIVIRSQNSPLPSVDFGVAGDAGRNVFRCNSSPVTRHNGDGGDVLVQMPMADGVLPFEGNVWDHAPPHIDPAGNDVSILGPATVDVAAASSATSPACPSGHGPGM